MNCTGNQGVRVLRNRHHNQCPGDDCPGCLPCTEPHCLTCKTTHAEHTCPGCLAMARTNMDLTALLYDRLRAEAQQGRQALHTHNGVPGGEALVLLAPGNYRARGERQPDEMPNDHNPPRVVLAHWAAWWQAHTGKRVDATTMHDLHSYLNGQLHRLAQHPAFPTLARDLARTVHHLEDVLHAGDRPEISKVPCWECGARLEKRYADTAARDYWQCPRCGERYDRGRYDRAKHDHLASKGAERYVLLADAGAAVGRSMRTVQTWARTGKVSTRRDPVSGRVYVWWPDVRAQHQAAGTRRRRQP